jgi:serine/threonine protein phosphatase 1
MLKLVKKLLAPKPPLAPVQLRHRLTIPEDRVSDVFAIGDIHGRLDLLLAAEERIKAVFKATGLPAVIICLGDFIDRGPDSRGVIDHLVTKMEMPFYRICVCGNHDDAFLTFLKDDHFDPAWLEFGGDRTLLSYGIDAGYLLKMDPSGRELKLAARNAVPPSHVAFLERLPVAVTFGRYLFVHAGVLPGRPLAEQSDMDLMWIREPFLSQGPGTDMMVIHGHTPGTNFQHGPNRIGIDTGAYATGVLNVLHIGREGLFQF